MHRFILSLATFVVTLQSGFPASVQLPVNEEESIKNNLVEYESDAVEGLTPPMIEARNYFTSEKSVTNFENPYVVEIYKNYLNIKTSGLPTQKIKLNQTEGEGIQELSLSFVELLNSSKLSSQPFEYKKDTFDREKVSPMITITNSGVFLQFLNTSKTEPNATEISPENRQILWDFLTKYTRNIFEEKLKQLKLTEKYAEVLDDRMNSTDSSAFQNFMNFLWKVTKLSVDYAETAFEGWTTSQPDVTAAEAYRNVRPTTSTLFAYEEPSPVHEFPSQEFLYRRKDVDSIFYGRGVI